MLKIRAGTLRHKIKFQRPYESQDNVGAIVSGYDSFLRTRANIEPTTGNERFINDNLLNQVDHVIRMRSPRISILPSDRIIYKDRIFDIVRVLDSFERNVTYIILAKEKLNIKYVSMPENLLTESVSEIITESGENLTTEN